MKKSMLFLVILMCICLTASAEVSFTVKYFLSAARRLGNDLMIEGAYEYKHFLASLGFARLEAQNVAGTRFDEITYIPIGLGGPYSFTDWLRIKGGANYNIFFLQNESIQDMPGAFVGLEVGKNPFFEVTHRWGDMQVNTDLLEDSTKISGWSLGIGYRW